ncbi:MAG: hypothetical protein AAF702_17685 [Chloroflexota bacterium]
MFRSLAIPRPLKYLVPSIFPSTNLYRSLILVFLGLLFGCMHSGPAPLLAQGGNQDIYLPIMVRPPTVSNFIFRASNDCGTDNFSAFETSPVTYAHGIKQLTTAVQVTNGIDYTYRIEWLVGGVVQPNLGESGTVAESPEIFTSSVIFSSGSNCDSSLPRGQLTTRLYLNDRVIQEGAVTIQ